MDALISVLRASHASPQRTRSAVVPWGVSILGQTLRVRNVTRPAPRVLIAVDLRPVLNFLMMAAHDTITSSVTSMAWYLAQHSDWQERLRGGHYPSPVSANGLVYFVSSQGETTLVRPGETFDVVGKNALGEPVSASPAISQGQLFIRTHEHLYCIGKSTAAK